MLGLINAYEQAELKDSNKLSGKIIASIVKDFLSSINLNLKNCIAISTDTCSTMSSPNIGAIKYLQDDMPFAMHAFCLNHVTNLSLLDSLKIAPDISSAIKLIKDLSSFFM